MNITLITSIILFGISIFTFITSLMSKAQDNGKILEKIEQTQRDIGEIKETVKEMGKRAESLGLLTENQEQRIKNLEEKYKELLEMINKYH